MSRLTFYTNPMSRGRIVRWMLEELGELYETVVLDYDALKAPDYLAVNPMGKVPAIRHDGQVVTEAAAICAYLADAYPDAGLAPAPGDPERAPYLRWLFFAAGPVEAAVTNHALGLDPPADKARAVGYGSYGAVMDGLEAAVSAAPYIAGDRFSAADVYVGSQIMWGLLFGTMEKRPAFEAYWNRLADRPAHRRAEAIDDALMPKRDGDDGE